MNKRLLRSYNCAAENLGEPVSDRNVPSRAREQVHGGPGLRKNTSSYGDILIALSTVLRIRCVLDGAEIDALISDVQGGKRRGWRT